MPAFSPFPYALCGLGLCLTHYMDARYGFQTSSFSFIDFGWLLAFGFVLRVHPALDKVPRLRLAIDTIFLIAFVFDFSLTFPWQVQATSLPLQDEAVHAFDRALGFNHARYMTWLNDHPIVLAILTLAYKTFIPQICLLVGTLIVTGQARELDRYMSSFILAMLLVSLISAVVPTAGVVMFLDKGWSQSLAWPRYATDLTTFFGLRDGSLRDIRGIPVLGIISFPSFHAASGVLVAWSFRGQRLPMILSIIAINILMLIGTVGCGGHYVADVLSACIVAALAIALARVGSRWGYAALDAGCTALQATSSRLPFRRAA